MDKITPANYIRLQRKLCKPDVIITANQLAYEWGVTPEEVCYRVLSEALMKEGIRRKSDNLKK